MAATAVILTPGDVLGGFRIADVIGIGGMAIVYRAHQASLDREVALKVLSPELARDETFSERFRAEGMHAARLDHPNVIPVYDAGEADGRLYLAMRLVDGMSLAERLRVKPLTVRETLDILGPIASGLDAAHALGLIHRDVKPQNILLTEDGHPYLADFGVAKGVESAGLTASGGFVGTLNYAAPEQILGLATLPATDVYALAAVLYHCLTGAVPYPRDGQAGLMFAQVNESSPWVPLAEAEMFNTLMQRAMAKDPEERFASASALISAAEHALAHLPTPYATARPAFSSSPGSGTWPSGRGPVQQRDAARSSRSLKRSTIALGTVVAVAAATFAVLASLGGRAAASPKRVAQSPPLSIRYGSPWRTTDSAFGVFALSAPMRPGAAVPIQLAAGVTTLAAGYLSRSSAVPGGLPPPLAKYGRPAHSQALRGSPAAIYRWALDGVRNLSVWVVPTVRGDLAVICSAPVGINGALRSCEAMASRARVSGVARLPVGPDTRLARTLTQTLSKVGASAIALAGMFRAHPSKPAAVPDRLAAADELALRTLRRLDVPSRYQSALADLATALAAEAREASVLSTAISKDDRASYTSAARSLAEDGRDLSGLAGDLRRDVLLWSVLPSPAVPKLPAGTGAGSGAGVATNSGLTPATTPTPPPVTYPEPSSGGSSQTKTTKTSQSIVHFG